MFKQLSRGGTALLARTAKSDGKYSKVVTLLTTLVLVMSGLVLSPAHAAADGPVDCGTSGTFTITNNVVTSGGSCAGVADIPEGVTSIGDSAFGEAQLLTDITIPASVTSIGDSAFRGTWFLATVTIESGSQLASIGEYDFSEAVALTSITIPAGVTSIGEYAFADTTSLTAVSFGSGSQLTSISDYMFAGAESLPYLTIPASVTSIGEGAFRNADSLTSITIPASVTSIGESAFALAESLATVNFGSGSKLTSIGAWAFEDDYSLTEITIPASVTTIGDGAFSNATEGTIFNFLGPVPDVGGTASFFNEGDPGTAIVRFADTSYVVDNNMWNGLIVEHAEYAAPDGFYLCSTGALTTTGAPTYRVLDGEITLGGSCAGAVVIPDGVASIGESAFAGATALTSITIPESVTGIRTDAFDGATALTRITVDGANTKYSSAAGVLFENGYGLIFLLKYPAGKRGASYTIPAGVVVIGESAFAGATALTSISIPASVNSISWHAFASATALTSISIPEFVNYISAHAFDGATALTRITVDNANTYYSSADGVLFEQWYDGAQLYLGKLHIYPAGKIGSSYTIPEAVREIGEGAFDGATALTSITIPESVTYISEDAFDGATALTRITVAVNNLDYSSADGVLFNSDATTLIRYLAGKSETSYTIPASVTYISDDAFRNATSLTSITIPASVTYIGDGAFRSATSLSTVTFESGSQLTSIGYGAFENATSLTSITIPASVTYIGDGAFYGATALTSVYFLGQGSISRSDGPFYGVSSGAKAFVKSGITSFGSAGVIWQGLVVTVGFYTVTYNTNGGSVVTTQNHGANIATPTSPTRTGYTFAGWSANDGGSVITSFPYTPDSTGNIALYAKWTVIPVIDTPASAVVTPAPAVVTPAPAVVTPAPAVDNSSSLAAELAARTIGFKKSFSAKSLGKQIGVAIISPKATVSLSVAKASKKVCTKSGSKLKTLKAGNCVVTFTVQEPKPKVGKKPKATKTVKTLVVQ